MLHLHTCSQWPHQSGFWPPWKKDDGCTVGSAAVSSHFFTVRPYVGWFAGSVRYWILHFVWSDMMGVHKSLSCRKTSFESEQWMTYYWIYNIMKEDQVSKTEDQATPRTLGRSQDVPSYSYTTSAAWRSSPWTASRWTKDLKMSPASDDKGFENVAHLVLSCLYNLPYRIVK